MTRDDESKASLRERTRAEAFAALAGDLVERGDGASPPALDADERALAETVVAMRAILGEATLAPERAGAIIDRAYADLARPRAGAENPPSDRSRARKRRPLFYAIAWATAACAAATLVFFLAAPGAHHRDRGARHAELALSQKSRRADVLFGVIPAARSGEASARIDVIYADRLAGYRTLALGGLR